MTNNEIERLQTLNNACPEPTSKSLALTSVGDNIPALVAVYGSDYKEFLRNLGVSDYDIEKNYSRMMSDTSEDQKGNLIPKKPLTWALTLDALDIAAKTVNQNRNLDRKDTLGKYLDVLNGEANYELLMEAGHTYTLPNL